MGATANSAGAVAIGVNWSGEIEQSRNPGEWEAISHSGSSIYRIGFYRWDWTRGALQQKYDKVVEEAALHGVALLPYLEGREAKVPGFPPFSEAGSSEYVDWKEWIKEVVTRYGYSGSFWTTHPELPYRPVTAWEIWNEPNLPQENEGGVINPVAYGQFFVDMSEAAREASIHRSGADTKILLGGLYLGPVGKDAMPWKTFLTQMYAGMPGIANHYQALGVHPYAFDYAHTAPGSKTITEFTNELNEARSFVNGPLKDPKPLWITEMGWPVGGTGQPPASNEAEQERLLNESFNWVKANATSKGIEVMLWYNLRDINLPTWAYHIGLRREDGSFRPIWWALQAQAGAAEWPLPTWENENLGGLTASAPDVSARSENVLDVFARGSNNVLAHRSWDPVNHWSAWEQIGIGPALAGGPSSVSWGPNRIDVVGRIADGSVQHWSWDSSFGWNTENLGGNVIGDPEISSRGSNMVDVWARGTNNHLYFRSWDPTYKWSSWLGVPGPEITSSPGATSWSTNRIDLVARAGDGSVQHWSWDSSFGWNNHNLGGSVVGDPDISARGLGAQTVDIWAPGTDNHLYHRSWDPIHQWSGWEGIPGPEVTSGPGAVSWSSKRIDLVARAGDGSVQHWGWQALK